MASESELPKSGCNDNWYSSSSPSPTLLANRKYGNRNVMGTSSLNSSAIAMSTNQPPFPTQRTGGNIILISLVFAKHIAYALKDLQDITKAPNRLLRLAPWTTTRTQVTKRTRWRWGHSQRPILRVWPPKIDFHLLIPIDTLDIF